MGVASSGCRHHLLEHGVPGGPGGAACVSFDSATPCPSCQCIDGMACPNGNQSSCCTCDDGTACPFNQKSGCALCGNAPADAGTTDGGSTATDGGTDAGGGAGADAAWCCCDFPSDCIPGGGALFTDFAAWCSCQPGSMTGPDCASYCTGEIVNGSFPNYPDASVSSLASCN